MEGRVVSFVIRKPTPCDHDTAHPNRRREALQKQCRSRFCEHVRVVEDTQNPGPLIATEIAELLLDAVAFFDVDDCGVGDVADIDAHDQVDEGIP